MIVQISLGAFSPQWRRSSCMTYIWDDERGILVCEEIESIPETQAWSLLTEDTLGCCLLLVDEHILYEEKWTNEKDYRVVSQRFAVFSQTFIRQDLRDSLSNEIIPVGIFFPQEENIKTRTLYSIPSSL